MSGLSLFLAVVAAILNALSSVLQRLANRAEEVPFGRRLIGNLLHRPAWLGGFAALVISFLLQATALRFGTLAAVEPVLAVELPVTLALSVWILRARVRARDAATAVVMAVGLAAFLLGVGPSGGAPDVGRSSTVLACALTAAGVAALTAVGAWGPSRFAAVMLGAAAGSGFGLSAALMKIAVSGGSFGSFFARWELYAMAVAGLASVLLVQAALRAGTLVAVQPGLTLMDPLISVLWGTTVLGEQTNTGPILVLAVAGGAAIVGGVVLLSRSPALTEAE